MTDHLGHFCWVGPARRRVFYSLDFAKDFQRTRRVRNIARFEGQAICDREIWDAIKSHGEEAVETWLDLNMSGKCCLVVLVGSRTAERPWIGREIVKAWSASMGVIGIRINRLLDRDGNSSDPGENPFERIVFGDTGARMSEIAPLFTPLGPNNGAIIASVESKLEEWIDKGIFVRETNQVRGNPRLVP